MSWFSKHFGITLDNHSLGNLLKNASPAFAMTPLGLAGVAGASALGDLGRNKHNLGGIAAGALGNVGIGAGVRGLSGAFGGAGATGGGSASTSSAGGATGPSLDQLAAGKPPAIGMTPGTHSGAFGAAPAASGPSTSMGALSNAAGGVHPGAAAPQMAQAPGAIKKTASFLGDHSNAIGMGLQGLGQLSTSGAQNRMAKTQADAMQYELEQRRKRDLALEPLRRALAGQMDQLTKGSGPVAPNPYLNPPTTP